MNQGIATQRAPTLQPPIRHHVPILFKKTNLRVRAIKHRVGVVIHPVAKIEVAAPAILQSPVHRQMAVAENEVVRLDALTDFAVTILQKPFALRSEPVTLGRRGGGTAFLRRKIGQPSAQIRVKPTKQPLAQRMHEHLFHSLVAFVVWPEAVAVTNKKSFSVYLAPNRLFENRYPELLLKVAEHPQIVIARESKNGHASIAQLGQFAKQTAETLRNHRLVFEPEFEQITHQVNSLRIGSHHIKPAHHLSLAFGACQPRIRAQVKIGSEEGLFHRGKGIYLRRYICPRK